MKGDFIINAKSTEKFSESLFLYSSKLANQILSNKDIVTNPTLGDYEKIYHYCYALFFVHDFVHEKVFTYDTIYEAAVLLYAHLINEGYLSETSASENLKVSAESITDFLNIHLDFLRNRDDQNSSIQYTSSILSKIPSCEKYNGYSLVGVSFTLMLPEIIDNVGKYYEAILSDFKETSEENFDDLLERYFSEAPEEDSSQSDTQNDYEPVNQSELETKIVNNTSSSNNKAPEKKTKIVILLFALIASLCMNAYFLLDTTAEKKIKYLNNKVLSTERAKEAYKDDYLKYKADYENLKYDYDFYHNNAVFVTEAGSRYHRYECYHIDNKSYWIYNIEAAKSMGYTPCKDCFSSEYY